MSATISHPQILHPHRSHRQRSHRQRSRSHRAHRPAVATPEAAAWRHTGPRESQVSESPVSRSAVSGSIVSDATFRRRRAVVGGVLAVLVAAGAVLAHDVLAGSGGVPASAAVSQPARTTVTARPGDTLWSIAEHHRGEVPIGRYVDALVDVNGGPSIQAGQAVVLP